MEGIIYIMTTAVEGIIKIGKTGTKNFKERMRLLEQNGYHNVSGLQKYFAIELSDYDYKERLLQEIFADHRVENSELFSIDHELVKQLLLSFDGKVIFPENIDKEEEFDDITETREQSRLFNFYKKGLKDGDVIVFRGNPEIKAEICGEREVKFEDEVRSLSPLARELHRRKGDLNNSGSYRGAAEFEYNGTKLLDLEDK